MVRGVRACLRPLNAKGLLVSVNGQPLDLRTVGYDLEVEQHPRFTFHFEADLPPRGRLAIQDTNYESSEGTSRLALRGVGGLETRGDDLPVNVNLIPVRPVWQLSDAEERRTRQLDALFEPAAGRVVAAPAIPRGGRARPEAEGLSRLLDRSGASVIGLGMIALALGAAHAIQPGHGKALVAAAAVGEHGGWARGVVLALAITVAHVGGVLAVAVALWATRSTRYPDINRGLAHGAGFAIAAVGLWRLGRHLGGSGEHAASPDLASGLGTRGLIGLGLAGARSRAGTPSSSSFWPRRSAGSRWGWRLVTAFTLGMAAVLVAVGVMAARLRGLLLRWDREGDWPRRLGLLSALAVTAIGVYLLCS